MKFRAYDSLWHDLPTVLFFAALACIGAFVVMALYAIVTGVSMNATAPWYLVAAAWVVIALFAAFVGAVLASVVTARRGGAP